MLMLIMDSFIKMIVQFQVIALPTQKETIYYFFQMSKPYFLL